MRPRGTTLIELMVVVALVGISSMTFGAAARAQRSAGLAELQGEQAVLLLDYYADCLSSGRRPAPATALLLTQQLPSAKVAVTRGGALATVTVTWSSATGVAEKRAVTVFEKAAR